MAKKCLITRPCAEKVIDYAAMCQKSFLITRPWGEKIIDYAAMCRKSCLLRGKVAKKSLIMRPCAEKVVCYIRGHVAKKVVDYGTRTLMATFLNLSYNF